MRALTTLASGLSFAEAPRWREGFLYFSDMHARRVLRIGADGALQTVARIDSSTSGLGWLPDGRLLVVAMEARKVMVVEADGRVFEHADLGGIGSHNANDMVVGPDGVAYVGNFGFSVFPLGEPRTTALARVLPDGSVSAAASDLFFPNGITLSEDGRTLIVAESGALCLTAFTVGAGGELSDRRTWARFGEGEAPDGMCLDREGAAWVAIPHSHKFVRVREGGEIVDTIAVADYALSCVLGGPDRRTLFMAVSSEMEPQACLAKRGGGMLAAEVDVSGTGWP